jgi:hypothetical protein
MATRALESEIIDLSVYRFLTQHCRGQSRTPRAQILVKTHKHMCPIDDPPANIRLYIDTVGYTTTPLAKFISVCLTPARENIQYRIVDTAHLMRQISQITFPQSIRLVTMDVKDFYPNTTTAEGNTVINKYLPLDIAQLCTDFNALIHESMYVQTPSGWHSVPDRYGIGFGHSCEICDLNYSTTEQTALANLAMVHGITPLFYGRMIDDILMITDCTDDQLETVKSQFETLDPSKPITFTVSDYSVDFLDVTLSKGPGFIQSGKLDTKLYTKPASSNLHLPRTSHHPPSTFQSILTGQKRRSIIASSSLSSHSAEMIKRYKQYSARGYGSEELRNTLWQRPALKSAEADKWEAKSRYQKLRERILGQESSKHTEKVMPLRLKYTPRTVQLSKTLNLQSLQKEIEKNNPALSRASIGRFTIANLKTQSIRGSVRQKYL